MYFLYTLIQSLLALPLLLLSPKKRLGSFTNRLGFFDIQKLQEPIWIHAVSVGEVLSIQPLIRHLKQALPNTPIVLSTITSTGQHVASKSKIDALIYFPFDFNYSVRRALDQVNPKMVIITETEIWPNFLRACRRKKIPVMWINGRISDKSYPRYLVIRFFLKNILSDYSRIGMQSEIDFHRVISLGADPKKFFSVGNLKYDIHPLNKALPKNLEQYLVSAQPLWIAASTMPGEEEMVLMAYRQLQKTYPALKLLIAPRHPERFEAVARRLQKNDLPYLRRSTMDNDAQRPDIAPVMLLDSLGELAATFEFASVVFVGGSLMSHGGHNILEPAFFSKPILFGPHMENFQEIANRFLQENAAVQIAETRPVQSSLEMAEKIDAILSDEIYAKNLGSNAKRIVNENRGATQKTVSLIYEEIQKLQCQN